MFTERDENDVATEHEVWICIHTYIYANFYLSLCIIIYVHIDFMSVLIYVHVHTDTAVSKSDSS
jgi:hypothetical protein